jgi:uncharacterized membrane protein
MEAIKINKFMKFNARYFIAFIFLLLTEILIAAYIKQPFIRFVFGDFLVVILLYCFLKSFIKTSSFNSALYVLIFAFSIEFLQMSNVLALLNLEKNKLANIILGNTFEITDLIAYTLGVCSAYLIDKKATKN